MRHPAADPFIPRAAAAMLVVVVLFVPILAPADASAVAEEPDDPGRVERLESEVERLRAELEALAAELDEEQEEDAEPSRIAELERRIEILASELERLRLGEEVATADRSDRGLAPAASKVYRTEQGLSIGGYGEILYESFDSSRDDGSPSGATDEFDALRAVLYFGYRFDDKWIFNSEIEVEHADEVGLEFAYIDYLWRPDLSFRGGILLAPLGFVNELHEPPIFLGAKRPVIESVIIPTTWRENGAGIYGEKGPFSYRAYVMNGLDASGFSAGGLRGGRQKGSQAKADDFALTARVDYSPRPGFLIGGSAYRGGSGQDLGPDVTTTLLEGHLEWRFKGLQTRLLAVSADLDDVAELNSVLGLSGAASVGESLSGYYAEVGYDVLSRRGGDAQLTPFVRYSELDTQDEVPDGFLRDPANDREILTLGIDFKPIDQVVLKADWQDFENGAGTGIDQFNVAIGWLF